MSFTPCPSHRCTCPSHPFTPLDAWKLWLVDTAAAFEYGRLAFELKTIGRPIGQNDIVIAAIALSLGNTTVVTTDTDLAAVPGLSRKLGGGHVTNDQSNRRENSKELVGSPIAVLMVLTASSRIHGFNGDWPRQRGLHTSNRDTGFSQTSRVERFPTINLRFIEQLPRGIRWHVRLSLHSCMRS